MTQNYKVAWTENVLGRNFTIGGGAGGRGASPPPPLADKGANGIKCYRTTIPQT